jgi:uncharacterized membrane protein
LDSELVVLYFESTDAAERGFATLQALDAEGFLEIDECVILGRDAQGWVTAKSADEGEVSRAAGFGSVLGLFVGGVIGLPVLGVLAGAGLAAKHKIDADRLEELISSVGQEMASGSGVLALSLASLSDPATVADRLEVDRDGLIRADIPAALREEIDRSLGT